MAGDIKPQYCPICDTHTEHEQGCFKCKEINGELFYLKTSTSEALKKISTGFKDYIVSENNGLMNCDSPVEYMNKGGGGIDFEELFAPQLRSLKCSSCGHLIKLSRLP